MSARPSDPNDLATCRTDLGPLTRKLLEQQQEIERLRAERDEARQERDAVKGYLEAADDVRIRCVAAIRAERDAARRQVCVTLYTDKEMQRNHACLCGWDCFKEGKA